MPNPICIEDMAVEEINELLAAGGDQLVAQEQVLALQQFVREVGGLENATVAIQMLAKMEASQPQSK